MIFDHLACKLFGHRWRQLTRKERATYPHIGAADKTRICHRCGAERIAKARRKANPKPTQENT